MFSLIFHKVLFFLLWATFSLSQDKEEDVITEAAVGRMAYLGDMFDKRSNSFGGSNIFIEKLPGEVKDIVDDPFSTIDVSVANTLEEKINKLDVSAEIAIDVATDINLKGSARYLNEDKKTENVEKISVFYFTRTKYEKLKLHYKTLKPLISVDALKSQLATHVVTEISWGANTIVSCSFEQKGNLTTTEISGQLKAELNKYGISGNASVNYTRANKYDVLQFDVKIYGDILTTTETLPTDFKGAMKLIKEIPIMISNSNNGKGRPITYKLMPIAVIAALKKDEVEASVISHNIDTAILDNLLKLFDEISNIQQKLNTLYYMSQLYKNWITNEDRFNIIDMVDSISIEEAKFRYDISVRLEKVRDGSDSSQILAERIKEFQISHAAPAKVTYALSKWRKLQRRVSYAKRLVQDEFTYIGLDSSLDDQLNFDSTAYVLYLSRSANDVWKNCTTEMKKIKNNPVKNPPGEESKFLVIDCELHKCPYVGEDLNYFSVFKGELRTIFSYFNKTKTHRKDRNNSLAELLDWEEELENTESILRRQRDTYKIPGLQPDRLPGVWVQNRQGLLPDNRFEVENIYICKMVYKGSTYAGQVNKQFTNCMSYTIQINLQSTSFEVLTLPKNSVFWVSLNQYQTDVPAAAIAIVSAPKQLKFICKRGKHGDIGTFHPKFGACYQMDNSTDDKARNVLEPATKSARVAENTYILVRVSTSFLELK